MIWYFEYEKGRMQKKRIAEANKTVGKPKVGGSFKLVDQDGKPFTDADLKGKYSLVRKSIQSILSNALWLICGSFVFPI